MEKKTTENNNGWGGARKGAGRKELKVKAKSISFKCSPEENKKISDRDVLNKSRKYC